MWQLQRRQHHRWLFLQESACNGRSHGPGCYSHCFHLSLQGHACIQRPADGSGVIWCREQTTYKFAAILASTGVTAMAITAVYFRFTWHMRDGAEFPVLEAAATLLLTFGGVVRCWLSGMSLPNACLQGCNDDAGVVCGRWAWRCGQGGLTRCCGMTTRQAGRCTSRTMCRGLGLLRPTTSMPLSMPSRPLPSACMGEPLRCSADTVGVCLWIWKFEGWACLMHLVLPAGSRRLL